MEERTQLPAEVWERLRADRERPTPITAEVWARLHRALDAGAPVSLACQYAGLPYVTWLAECERVPELAIEAGRVSASGPVAALLFLQQTATSEWRAALEFLKAARPDLFGTGASRAREMARAGEVADDELDADISPADVAAVLRLLGAGSLASEGERDVAGEPDSHPNGQRVQPDAGVDGDGGRG